MAFVKFPFNREPGGHVLRKGVTITLRGQIRIARDLLKEVCPGAAYADCYFDENTLRIAIHLLLERPDVTAAKVSYHVTDTNSRQAVSISAIALIKAYRIASHSGIPATIETVDGKKMIVFPVKIKETS